MDLFNIKMITNKKAALYDEFPVAIVSSVLIFLTMIGLHIMVTIQDSNSPDLEYSTQDIELSPYFYINDFLQMPLNDSQKQTYSQLIDKNLSEKVVVKHALTAPLEKDKIEPFFTEMKSLYMEENEEAMRNFAQFSSIRYIDTKDLLSFGHVSFDDTVGENFRTNCVAFESGKTVFIPQRLQKVDQQFVAIIFGTPPGCLESMVGRIVQ